MTKRGLASGVAGRSTILVRPRPRLRQSLVDTGDAASSDEEGFARIVLSVIGAEVEEVDAWLMPTPPPQREQGWKLHVSATLVSAPQVLARVLPILKASGASFKLAASPSYLGDLNSGASGYSQVGKFMTVYPQSDEQAVELAQRLDRATSGLAGPRVPSDRHLHRNSLVSYRYGAFAGLQLVDDLGQRRPAMREPGGALVPDERLPGFSPPEWTDDPFERAGIVEEAVRPDSALFCGYLILDVLHQSAKGGVYLALDPSVSPPRTCVIKEARRHVASDSTGADIRLQLEKQHVLLQSLHGDVPVPETFAAHWNGRYWVITLSADEHPLRQRFSLAHEFKHVIDHTTTVFLYANRPYMSAYEQAERVADYFAACLLMPKRVVTRLWCQGHQNTAMLARMLQVSEPALRYRLDQLGLTERPRRCLQPRIRHSKRPSIALARRRS